MRRRSSVWDPAAVDIDVGGGVVAKYSGSQIRSRIQAASRMGRGGPFLCLSSMVFRSSRVNSGLAPSLALDVRDTEGAPSRIEPPPRGFSGQRLKRAEAAPPPRARKTGVLIGVTDPRPRRRERGGAEGPTKGPRGTPTSARRPGQRSSKASSVGRVSIAPGMAGASRCQAVGRLDTVIAAPRRRLPGAGGPRKRRLPVLGGWCSIWLFQP